jgi:hypothetical protein
LIPLISAAESLAQKLQITFMQLENNSAAPYRQYPCFSPREPHVDETASRAPARRCSGLVREAAVPRVFAPFCTLDGPRVAATIARTQQKLMR